MKTAISIPTETFWRVSERASQLGMSRSEFFTRAVVNYLDQLDDQTLTQQIDAALALEGEDSSGRDAAEHGRRRLTAADSDEW